MPGGPRNKSKSQMKYTPDKTYERRRRQRRTRRNSQYDKTLGRSGPRRRNFTDTETKIIYFAAGLAMAQLASAEMADGKMAGEEMEDREELPPGWEIVYYPDENEIEMKGYINTRDTITYNLVFNEKSGDPFRVVVNDQIMGGIIPTMEDGALLQEGDSFDYIIPQRRPPVVKHGATHCHQPGITSYPAAAINSITHHVRGTGRDLENCGPEQKDIEVSDTTAYILSAGLAFTGVYLAAYAAGAVTLEGSAAALGWGGLTGAGAAEASIGAGAAACGTTCPIHAANYIIGTAATAVAVQRGLQRGPPQSTFRRRLNYGVTIVRFIDSARKRIGNRERRMQEETKMRRREGKYDQRNTEGRGYHRGAPRKGVKRDPDSPARHSEHAVPLYPIKKGDVPRVYRRGAVDYGEADGTMDDIWDDPGPAGQPISMTARQTGSLLRGFGNTVL